MCVLYKALTTAQISIPATLLELPTHESVSRVNTGVGVTLHNIASVPPVLWRQMIMKAGVHTPRRVVDRHLLCVCCVDVCVCVCVCVA